MNCDHSIYENRPNRAKRCTRATVDQKPSPRPAATGTQVHKASQPPLGRKLQLQQCIKACTLYPLLRLTLWPPAHACAVACEGVKTPSSNTRPPHSSRAPLCLAARRTALGSTAMSVPPHHHRHHHHHRRRRLLCYDPALVPEGGAAVYGSTKGLTKAWNKDAAGHLFHLFALKQAGLFGEHSGSRQAAGRWVAALAAAAAGTGRRCMRAAAHQHACCLFVSRSDTEQTGLVVEAISTILHSLHDLPPAMAAAPPAVDPEEESATEDDASSTTTSRINSTNDFGALEDENVAG